MKEEKEFTTLRLPTQLRDNLDELKVHRNEPLYDVINRLIKKIKGD